MAKGYKRRYYRGNKDKYSVEQTLFDTQLTLGQTTSIDVVPAVALQGMRKVKHLTISACSSSLNSFGVLWALVYVPQGMAVPGFAVASGGPLVEPNQFVMSCGTFDHDAGPIRIRSPLSRNLNSGDKIVLLLYPVTLGGQGAPNITGIVRYAITLQ